MLCYLHSSACSAWRGQRTESSEMSYRCEPPMWMLGIWDKSSGRTISAPDYWSISTAPIKRFLIINSSIIKKKKKSRRLQKPEALDLPDLELQADVRLLRRVAETELGSFGKAVRALTAEHSLRPCMFYTPNVVTRKLNSLSFIVTYTQRCLFKKHLVTSMFVKGLQESLPY